MLAPLPVYPQFRTSPGGSTSSWPLHKSARWTIQGQSAPYKRPPVKWDCAGGHLCCQVGYRGKTTGKPKPLRYQHALPASFFLFYGVGALSWSTCRYFSTSITWLGLTVDRKILPFFYPEVLQMIYVLSWFVCQGFQTGRSIEFLLWKEHHVLDPLVRKFLHKKQQKNNKKLYPCQPSNNAPPRLALLKTRVLRQQTEAFEAAQQAELCTLDCACRQETPAGGDIHRGAAAAWTIGPLVWSRNGFIFLKKRDGLLREIQWKKHEHSVANVQLLPLCNWCCLDETLINMPKFSYCACKSGQWRTFAKNICKECQHISTQLCPWVIVFWCSQKHHVCPPLPGALAIGVHQTGSRWTNHYGI